MEVLQQFVGQGFRRQVVIFEAWIYISREIEILKWDWECAYECCTIHPTEIAGDEEVTGNIISSVFLQKRSKKLFAVNGAQLTHGGLWVQLQCHCLLSLIRRENGDVFVVVRAHSRNLRVFIYTIYVPNSSGLLKDMQFVCKPRWRLPRVSNF